MNAFRLGLSSWRRTVLTAPRPHLSRRALFPPLRNRRYASYQRFDGRGGAQSSRFNPAGRITFLWSNYRPVIIGTGAAGGVFYLYNLEQVPISGRRRFNCISAETEKKLFGDSGYGELLQQFQGKILPAYHPYTQLVAHVCERLLPSTGDLAGDGWVVHVIDDPNQKNAFVVPGGKVFFFSGILPICQDENGVAAVLGHEIAHNVAHHAAERVSRSVFVLLVALIAANLFDISGGSSKFIVDLFLSLPNSRTQEAEADHIGLLMMAESCFDPNAAVDFWRRMAQAEKGAPPQFLSTHPSSSNRMDTMKSWMPEATEKYESSECGITSGYAREFKKAFGTSSIPAGRIQKRENEGVRRQDDDDFF